MYTTNRQPLHLLTHQQHQTWGMHCTMTLAGNTHSVSRDHLNDHLQSTPSGFLLPCTCMASTNLACAQAQHNAYDRPTSMTCPSMQPPPLCQLIWQPASPPSRNNCSAIHSPLTAAVKSKACRMPGPFPDQLKCWQPAQRDEQAHQPKWKGKQGHSRLLASNAMPPAQCMYFFSDVTTLLAGPALKQHMCACIQ